MFAQIQRQDQRVLQPRRDRLGGIVDGLRSIDAVGGDVAVDVSPCLGGDLITEKITLYKIDTPEKISSQAM